MIHDCALAGHPDTILTSLSVLPCSKLREWQIGVSLFSLGNVANFVSFGENCCAGTWRTQATHAH